MRSFLELQNDSRILNILLECFENLTRLQVWRFVNGCHCTPIDSDAATRHWPPRCCDNRASPRDNSGTTVSGTGEFNGSMQLGFWWFLIIKLRILFCIMVQSPNVSAHWKHSKTPQSGWIRIFHLPLLPPKRTLFQGVALKTWRKHHRHHHHHHHHHHPPHPAKIN